MSISKLGSLCLVAGGEFALSSGQIPLQRRRPNGQGLSQRLRTLSRVSPPIYVLLLLLLAVLHLHGASAWPGYRWTHFGLRPWSKLGRQVPGGGAELSISAVLPLHAAAEEHGGQTGAEQAQGHDSSHRYVKNKYIHGCPLGTRRLNACSVLLSRLCINRIKIAQYYNRLSLWVE